MFVGETLSTLRTWSMSRVFEILVDGFVMSVVENVEDRGANLHSHTTRYPPVDFDNCCCRKGLMRARRGRTSAGETKIL